MKTNKWKLILVRKDKDIIVDSFPTKELAEEELRFRTSLCMAMGYSPDIPYCVQKIN